MTQLYTDMTVVTVAPVVEKLKYGHLLKTIKTCENAFKDDPVYRYVDDTPDPLWRRKISIMYRNISDAAHLITSMRSRSSMALTIDQGSALVVGTAPRKNGPEPEDPIEPLWKLIKRIGSSLSPPERTRRFREIESKMQEVVRRVLGEDVNTYFFLDLLATAPECQGRGYGSALARSLKNEADIQGRKTWLISSNINNTGFYNSLGFLTVETFLLGESNPTWHGRPIVLSLMVREPNPMGWADEKHLVGCPDWC